MFTVVPDGCPGHEGRKDHSPSLIDEIVREGARRMLAEALRAEVDGYRIFAVTNERILVLDAGKWSMKKARGIVAELPRSTRVGPASGLWHPITVDGKTVRVNRRFFKDIEAADATAAGSV